MTQKWLGTLDLESEEYLIISNAADLWKCLMIIINNNSTKNTEKMLYIKISKTEKMTYFLLEITYSHLDITSNYFKGIFLMLPL